jgi:hypothetical protein
MVKVRLETSREHVAEPARLRDPVGAVEELVWNAVDADAERVVVTLERNDLGGEWPGVAGDQRDLGVDLVAQERETGALCPTTGLTTRGTSSTYSGAS